MEKQTKKHYPLENKHSTIGNICCQGCYRIGLEQGKALALADEIEFLNEVYNILEVNDYECALIWDKIEERLAKLQDKTAQEMKA